MTRPILFFLVLSTVCMVSAQRFEPTLEAIYPLEALHSDAYGYAITASQDNKLSFMDVDVIAIQHRYVNEQPVVLIRVSGDLIEQTGGLAAGMSGSPVYLEHQGEYKLLGAIGYTFPNADHTLGLVTPIQVMQGNFTAVEAALAQLNTGQQIAEFRAQDIGEARAITTPLLMTGLQDDSLELFTESFQDFFQGAISPLALQGDANNAWARNDNDFVLEAGSAISVQLVRGDVVISAMGTLTYIDTSEGSPLFYAFGHPLLSLGEVSFDLSPAYISYIVPSQVVPFKLGNVGEAVMGRVIRDSDYGISGSLEQRANYLPVNLTLNGPNGSEQISFQMVNDERLYAPLLAVASLQAFYDSVGYTALGTADIAWDIGLRLVGEEESKRLRVLEQTLDENDLARRVARLLAVPLDVLAGNIYADAIIEQVNISVTWQEKLEFQEVVDATSESKKVNAGATLPVFVRLQRYRQAAEVVEFAVPIPEEASGKLTLVVRGGNEEPLRSSEERESDPILSFDELLLSMREQVQANELIIEAYIDGEPRRLLRRSFDVPIVGRANVRLEVDNPDEDANDRNDTPKEQTDEEEHPIGITLPNDAPPSEGLANPHNQATNAQNLPARSVQNNTQGNIQGNTQGDIQGAH